MPTPGLAMENESVNRAPETTTENGAGAGEMLGSEIAKDEENHAGRKVVNRGEGRGP